MRKIVVQTYDLDLYAVYDADRIEGSRAYMVAGCVLGHEIDRIWAAYEDSRRASHNRNTG